MVVFSFFNRGKDVARFCLLFNFFIYGHAVPSLLRGLFSSLGEWGLLFVAVGGLLTVVASLAAERRL